MIFSLRSVAALLFAGAFSASSAFAEVCPQDKVALRGEWGKAEFNIELALTPAEKAKGLMHRSEMDKNAGMLFLFDPPQRVSFWMRNTFIPLDMIFADRQGIVRHVHGNAIPHDETPIGGGPGIYAVLEINGGLAALYGITPGSELRHPLFNPQAAWPCPVE